MKKRLVLLVLLILVAGAVYYAWQRFSADGVDDGTLKIYGTIDIRDTNLAFNDQERVAEVLVEEGDQVARGQVLARLNTDRLQANIAATEAQIAAQQQQVAKLTFGYRTQDIDQAAAEVEAARAQAANSALVLKRLAATVGTGATSQRNVDDARAQLRIDQAQLRVKEKKYELYKEGYRREDIEAARHQLTALTAQLAFLNVRLAETTLIAPADGTIQSRILEPGEMAGPAMPVVNLAENDPKWVRAYLPEPLLGQVRPGIKAEIFSDSWPNEPMTGWVGFISPVAEFTPRTVQTEDLRTMLVYETRVYVHDPKNRLRRGMPVTVTLAENGEEASDVLTAEPAPRATPQ
ncbi:MAG: efflux RND transporter periplasmic adaptor subunit [Desulfopila sp.]